MFFFYLPILFKLLIIELQDIVGCAILGTAVRSPRLQVPGLKIPSEENSVPVKALYLKLEEHYKYRTNFESLIIFIVKRFTEPKRVVDIVKL